MALAIFPNPAFGILAAFIIEDLGSTRAEIGLLATAFALTGGLASPFVGRTADRLGAKGVLLALFAISAVSLVAISAANTYGLMLAASMFAGLAQASANPSTNKLIGLNVDVGRRGFVTGIKQSGVQIGVFVGGLALPALAIAFGWRVALSSFALVSLIGLVLAWRFIPQDPPRSTVETEQNLKMPVDVYWLMTFGFFMGLTVGAMFVYLPLYATEGVGLSVTGAGLIASLYGLVGAAARILWTPVAERMSHFSLPLLGIALLSLVSVAFIWLAATNGTTFLIIGAILSAASAPAWSSVGMLAVISIVPNELAGRASGLLVLGFAMGIAIGPPLFGLSVDITGLYNLGYASAAIVGFTSVGVIGLWRNQTLEKS
jgi:predicted MFS family arabinose efflux permease